MIDNGCKEITGRITLDYIKGSYMVMLIKSIYNLGMQMSQNKNNSKKYKKLRKSKISNGECIWVSCMID